jgi:Kef-type K+ transport system membrane component KefB
MNPQDVSWVDVVSPIFTFLVVIIVPAAVAGWVIFRTLTDKGDDEENELEEPLEE